MITSYNFIPWVRSGLADLISGPELGKDALPTGATSRVSIPLTLQVNDQDVSGGPRPQLYGPGDVIGIDPREIIRTGPLPQTSEYAPEKFALIEFDRPDFPWLFTPGKAHTEPELESNTPRVDCLRPWIVLVVVQKSLATVIPPTRESLPSLVCPAQELPSASTLQESWAWAHAQYVGEEQLEAGLVATKLTDDHSDRNLSRVLCPRKLAPHTAYIACLVPAFEAGRKAGLGIPVDPDKEPLAYWQFETDDHVQLPIYYHWEFSTGEQDHFIELAKKLQPLTKDELAQAQSGIVREMDLGDPGNHIGQIKLPIPSALGILPPTSETPEEVKNKLKKLLTQPQGTSIPLPVYGSWHAPAGEISTQLDSHLWLRMLNLDPCYRVAAALGTQIIQQEQDHLVAAAWEQVAELQRVNRYLQQKQLGCWTTDSIHQNRLAPLSTSAFAQITERLFLTGPESRDTSQQSETQPVPRQGPENSPQFRRMTRAGGPWAITGNFADYDPERIAPPPGATEGAKQVSGYRLPKSQQPKGPSHPASVRAATADSVKHDVLKRTEPTSTFLRHRVHFPETTRLSKDLSESHREGSHFQQHGSLGSYTYAPTFLQPMSEPLRDHFPHMLLPGLDKIPNNRATLLETNAKFIEAYMVGLNHEMSREFLWREFPTMLHTSYFQQFWDVRGTTDSQQPDIPNLRDWSKDLGQNLVTGRGGDLTFLLIRGELIVRYPNALIYARKHGAAPSADPRLPALRISPIPGVVLLGFMGFTMSTVGEWNFFVEEHFTEPYLGTNGQVSDHAYVSFQAYRNSAEVASESLQDRYVQEIIVQRAIDGMK